MEIKTIANDEGRIIALQVAFSALVKLMSQSNPEIFNKLINNLEETGMNPENAGSAAAFHELIEMIRFHENEE